MSTDEQAGLDTAPLTELVSTFAQARHCPSVAWGLLLDDRLAATGSIGGVTEDSVFRIASMTKSFSAAATLLLRDEGVVRLDEAIGSYAPELGTLGHHDWAPITVRDLLTMTSGLPTDDPWADRHLDLTDDEFDRIVADKPLFAFPTGQRFEYSNFGFALLGRVVHRATGRPIQEIVTERLLNPLGMTATTWTRPDHDDWARPRRWFGDTREFGDELDPLPDGLIAPMGGLWTSVADLATWVAWLDGAFPARSGDDDGPLRRSSRREMQSPQRWVGMRTVRGVRTPTSYGFGLRIADEPDHGTVVDHSGGLPGYGSNMRWLPGRGVGVIALANSTYAPMTELTALLLDLVTEQDLVPAQRIDVSPDVAEIAPRLVALLQDWDDDVAVDLCTASLVQDDSFDRRRAASVRLIESWGSLTIVAIEPTNAAGALVRCRGIDGAEIDVTLLLAPRRPARIQSYTVTERPLGDPPG